MGQELSPVHNGPGSALQASTKQSLNHAGRISPTTRRDRETERERERKKDGERERQKDTLRDYFADRATR
jgi:hypothetical protein